MKTELSQMTSSHTGHSSHAGRTSFALSALMLAGLMATWGADAAIALDRTRVILNGGDNTVSMTVTNQNKELPYLAQAWVEDENGNKIESPLTVLPPLQRVEPGAKTQVKVQVTGGQNLLAQDKETLYYFNLREIPPKTTKANTLQIALQTRIKLFYRPKSIAIDRQGQENPYQEKVTLTRQGDHFVANNPTPYYVTLVSVAASEKGNSIAGFNPMMVPPKGSATLGGSAAAAGSSPVLTYINDFGGRPKLTFSCSGDQCTVKAGKKG